jgi:hypothetical protein
LAAAAVFLFFLPVYFLTMSRNYSPDALMNALAAESGDAPRWFHGNHPFYPFIGVLWYKVERLFGYNGYAMASMTRLNVFLSVAGLSLLARTLCRFLNPISSVVVVFFLGSLLCIWHPAVDVVAIGAAIPFTMVVIVYLAELMDRRALSWLSIGILSCLSALLTLVHGIAIFHIFVVTAWLFLRIKPYDTKAALRYFVGAVGAVGFAYVFIYVVVVRVHYPLGFLRWAIGYAAYDGVANTGKSPYWGFQSLAILQGLWRGWINAFISSDANGGTAFFAAALGVLSAIITALSFVLVRKKSPAVRAFFWMLVAWSAGMTMFLAVWCPGFH